VLKNKDSRNYSMTKHAFAPHQISQDQIKALHDNVLVSDMEFDTRITQTGLILPNDNGTTLGIRPRWGRVYAVGKDQQDVRVGQWICVAHGRWTRGIDIEDGSGPVKRTIRKIDPADILLVSDRDERPQDDTMSTAVHVPKQSRD
jgi:co-chaperonin GroES (HSP10)